MNKADIQKKYTIGVDIGGTNMRAVLFDGEKVIADYELATPKDNLEHFLIMLKALVEPLIERAEADQAKIKGIGLGVAGVINQKDRRVVKSPNLPIIDDSKLAFLLESKIKIPAMIDNDANCFVRAEGTLGAGKKAKNVYGAVIGTGIGGGWWHEGKVYAGWHGGAGEPGHMIIDYKEGITLEEAYHKLTQGNPAQLAEEAYRGDTLAEKVFSEIGHDLGVAFANIVNILDPEIIVIGGGVVESSDLFLKQAKKTMAKYVFSPEAKKIKIVKSELGNLSGAIGAALLVA
ncbi:MAG: ROK family protein [Patescibacteria group bacterium]|jgi:glucokinase